MRTPPKHGDCLRLPEEMHLMVKSKDDQPHAVDKYVGGRMRVRRVQVGMSQGQLANRIGVSFQAVQKYESGDIRLSASRLYDVAQALDIGPAFFFEGYPDGITPQALATEGGGPQAVETFDRHEIMSLVRGYYGITDAAIRADILRLVRRLGNLPSEE
jgi:transcriptional regulator with XRE-family HTH domain